MRHVIDHLEEEKALKVFNRVQQHIELTHESLLLKDSESNLRALMFFYEQYAATSLGSINFWKKLEKMLANDLKRKTI